MFLKPIQNNKQISNSNQSIQNAQLTLDDLSITSDDELINICFDDKGFSNFFDSKIYLPKNIYPDIFPGYPKHLVQLIKQFTSNYSKSHRVKTLNYALNYCFVLLHVSYKVGLCKILFPQQKQKYSFQLFSFYLKFQAISNFIKLKQIIKILIGELDIRKNFNLHETIKDILKNCKNTKFDNEIGSKLLNLVDQTILDLLKSCKNMNITIEYTKLIDISLFKQLEIFKDIFTLLDLSKYENLSIIQQNMNKLQIRKKHQKNTKLYVIEFYKKIKPYYDKYSTRQLCELIYFLILIKINHDDLIGQCLNYIERQKMKIQTVSKILKQSNTSDFVLKCNINFRANLPRLHLMLRLNGFIKICSFLHEADENQMYIQLYWLLNSETKLKT